MTDELESQDRKQRGHAMRYVVRTRMWTVSLAACLGVAGCDGGRRVPGDAAGGADTAALLTTDTLAWYREGRPVEFGGRRWRPAGKPLALDTISVHVIGEFEGMRVYAAKEEEAATARYLLFPLTDSLWQALEPADSLEL